MLGRFFSPLTFIKVSNSYESFHMEELPSQTVVHISDGERFERRWQLPVLVLMLW